MVTEAELLERERAFWGAGGVGAVYREHFADEGRCVFAMGVLDKPATVAAIDAAGPWSDVSFADVQLVPLGAEAAALVYTATARRDGGEAPYRARVSSAYVRRDGRWLLALHQQTPVD